MRAPKFFYAATAAMALAVPCATFAVAETVETVPATKIEPGKTVQLAKAETEEPAKPSGVKITAVEAAKPKPKPARPTLRASINLSSQTMTVKENGQTKYTWKISSGRGGYHTPTGNYRPQWMTRMHYSKKYDNAPMPHSVFFHRGYAIHATYATKALGRPASHGCIRLSPSHAKKFYSLVSKHGKARTRIAITGSTPARSYAKTKKTRRKKYSGGYSGGYSNFWGDPGYSTYKKPSKKKRRKAKYYKPAKKKAYKPSYSYSYNAPQKFTWPGDR